MGLRFERSHSPFLLRPVCFICRGRYDLAVSADSRCKRCRKSPTGRRQRARYYARPLSVLRNDVVKGGEEIPEGVAEPIGSQRADARSNVHADDGRLDFFDSAYNGCPPRLRDRIGRGK